MKDDDDGGGKGAGDAEVRNTTEWGHLRRTTSTKYRTGFAAYRPSGTRHELEMSESWLPLMRYEMRRPAAPSPQPIHGTWLDRAEPGSSDGRERCAGGGPYLPYRVKASDRD